MVTEVGDPCDAQLCGRHPLTLSDIFEAFDDLEVLPESL